MQRLMRTWVEISIDNLEHNYQQVRSLLRADTRVMAVVKADGYGHGAAQVAQTMQACGADWFGVSNIMEARALRVAGITKPILILGYTPEEKARDLFELSCTQCVFGEDYAERLATVAHRENVIVDAHIKLDTGMNRLGFDVHNIENLTTQLARVCYLPNLKVTGIFTHFAAADENTDHGRYYTAMQHRRFATVMSELTKRGFAFRDVHCCNSGGTMYYPEYHHSMVRPGIILYGCFPSGAPVNGVQLKPVMTLKSVVSFVKQVRAGEKISYGCTYEAYENMKVATIPIGYADGYPRALSNRGYAFVCDRVVPIVGRVCMDQILLDVTGINVIEGDIVTLFGGNSPIGMDNVAGIVGTINYEIMCGISRRVERVYIKNGRVSEIVDYTQQQNK